MNSHDKPIKLNIGGKLFETRLSTLTRDPTHFFARITSEDWARKSNETIFVDRSPVPFNYILDYLRKGKVNLPSDKQFVCDINDEAEYYGIIGLQEFIKEHMLKEKTKQFDEDIIKREKRSSSVVSGNGTPTNVVLPIHTRSSPYRQTHTQTAAHTHTNTHTFNEPVTPNRHEEEIKKVKFQLQHTNSAPTGFDTNTRESPTALQAGSQTHTHAHAHPHPHAHTHTHILANSKFPMPFTPIVEPLIDFEADRRALVNDDPTPPSSCLGDIQDLGEPIFHTDEDF